jgi:hypothetical protein
MPAGNVAGLMGEHADELVRRFRLHDRADMEEHVLAVDDEGVEALVGDDVDIHVLAGDSGRAEDRLRVIGDQVLDLAVADEACREHAGRLGEQQAGGEGEHRDVFRGTPNAPVQRPGTE